MELVRGKEPNSRKFITGFSLAEAVVGGRDNDEIVLPGVRQFTLRLDGVRALLREQFKLTPQQFAELSAQERDRIVRKIEGMVRREYKKQYPALWSGDVAEHRENLARLREHRTLLHQSLRDWAAGPLHLEKPQGSSYHHLIEYDRMTHDPSDKTSAMEELVRVVGTPELVVVENDWAQALAGRDLEGAIRMPWPHAIWEFRISGVRVLAFVRYDDETETSSTFCVYGRDGSWVADDYRYEEHDGLIVKHCTDEGLRGNEKEFPRVAAMVRLQIRAACVLLDVGATHREKVSAPRKLVEKREREGKSAPCGYEVVRLIPRAAAHRVARGGIRSGDRAPQRGHLRRGTWVHYDDQESGEVEYVNDGGFFVSKTWRRWHWAGDLNNMIEREYRL